MLEPWQRAGLDANLDRVRSQGQLAAGKFDPCDPDAVYELFAAGYDAQVAEEARAAAMQRLVDRETANARGTQ